MSDKLAFDQRITVPEHVLMRELEGESVLLNLDSERYFGLDETGTRMWSVLSTCKSIEPAVSRERIARGDTTQGNLKETAGSRRFKSPCRPGIQRAFPQPGYSAQALRWLYVLHAGDGSIQGQTTVLLSCIDPDPIGMGAATVADLSVAFILSAAAHTATG